MKTDKLIGARIREYEIVDLLGKGGMGAVYRARHMYLEEDRAIKVIRADYQSEEETVDRFIREARILSRLRHANLVQIFEFGTLEENVFFMVLELLQGESVQKRLEAVHRIPVDEAIRIIREASEGLHSAHEEGIIHRDISPD